MKADLIENLIVAHCSRDEGKFKDAIEVLAGDEEKKGNVPLAQRIRNAYKLKKVSDKRSIEAPLDTMSFSPQAAQGSAPRDKDSLLELYEIVESNVELSDVILSDSQKQIIEQVISEQKNTDELLKHNVTPSNRLLFCGPPGCGKTMTAYAIGNELSMKIAYVRLDGLISSYLGQTSTNLRKVFDSVRNQRIILFLDEFDAIAKKRDDSNELGELKRVVTTLLQNFDNMPSNVFLIAATNHEHLLDPAIWRRFNVTVTLDLPNNEQRQTLFKKWISEHDVDIKLDYALLAKISEGLNGAQIKELANAALKKYLIEKHLKTEDVTTILLQQLTKYSGDNEEAMKVMVDMIERGVSTRQIAKALGTPHTTLDYQLKKYRGKSDEQ
ncbi:AAA family ATPase [Dehalobacter sp. TeCB1]|uniref:AAA family ATPase n=1 Tax=Dehalobacter sp. TeCB1 TaxID=1843715 RepID=UPI00083B791C|nr:AAA family ATPase [Dehalobacter sp. TeCB1]OCZ54237.1 ATPase [Dehalobacter sp. TeCB1]